MKIVIHTDGSSESTKISINGEAQELVDFSFSVKGGGKAKILMVKKVDGKTFPISMWGNDLTFYDDYNPDKNGIKE